MLPLLQRLEKTLIRSEERLLALLVILMLSLAVYNVVYRNVLVPIQTRIVLGDKYGEEATPAPEQPKPEAKSATAADPDESADSDEGEGFGGGFEDEPEDDESGGFGGGFGDDEAEAESDSDEDESGGFGGDFDEPKPAPALKPAAADDSEGFGGDFDDDPAKKAEPADESGGFGGDFDDDADAKPTPSKPKSDDAAGFGGDFEDDSDSEPADDSAGFGGDFEDDSDSDSEGFGGDFEGDSEPTGTPGDSMAEVAVEDENKLEGFPAFVSESIDALKLEWIDVLLRQLVLFVGLLGGMLATQRRKHITVDALTMVLPKKVLPYIEVLTATLSLVVCILLAISGWNLVLISLEYPKELMEWADEWHFQMVFPIGFGLLAFHFLVRVLESTAEALWGSTNEEAA